ncbi:MAG: hypothetical protein KKC30_12410 [Proteobacteria bacterium]|nr:hypothetical protein [Pseudomonadota bacterium]MBU4384508.1 hypothetical protein [Pseudomonadota bacterium]MCG2766344.1 hypothetical protein [Desulfarculaceae bacterium]
MSTCRFMFSNLIPGPQALGVSSARPGMVGSPAAEALGSATCLAAGEHTGALDQVLVVEIDSLEAGSEVGLATFRWKRESAGAWEASGVVTSVSLTPLADGVSVKWVPGPGQEFYKGDRWSILATGCQGPQALMDRDRDTAWRSLDCAAQFIDADLGQAQEVRALVLADHNLGEGATAVLKARDTLHQPVWSYDPDGGQTADSLDQALSNGRATPRTFIDGGVVKYAAAGESCFEDGMLSIQPAATNLLAHSESFDETAWSVANGGIVSPNAFAAPDGNPTADQLSGLGAYIYQNATMTDGVGYTLSVWAYAIDGSVNLQFGTRTAGFALVNTKTQALDLGEWTRISFTFSKGSTETLIYFQIAATSTGTQACLWGAQLEVGSVPTAYIPTTTGTAYRAADAVSFPLPQAVRAAMSDGGQGCLAMEWLPGLDHTAFPLDVAQALFSTSTESGYTFLPLYLYRNSTGSRFSVYDLLRLRRSDAFVDFLNGQTYLAALRWRTGGDFQVGCDAAWGTAKSYEGAFNLSAGRISLGQSPRFPMRLGRVKLWEQWLEQEPESLLDPWEHPDYSQALTITTPHLVSFLEQSHRYWRLELDDPANPESLLRASLFYLGESFEPKRTFRAGYSQGSVATRRLVSGGGGKVAGSSGALAAYYQLEFARLDQADAEGLEEMLSAVHTGGEGGLRPLFFTPFAGDSGQTLYCLPGAELARQEAPGGRWNLSLRLEEVVKSDV